MTDLKKPSNKRQSQPLIKEEDEKKKVIDINSEDLQYILEINQRATEIYISVEQQQEEILETNRSHTVSVDNLTTQIYNQEKQIESLLKQIDTLSKANEAYIKDVPSKDLKDFISKNDKRIEEMDKNIFRLIIALSGSFISSIVAIIVALIKK